MSRLVIGVFLAAIAFYWAILPHRVDQLRPLSVDVPAPTGDEPYYLEMALSLRDYGTLELTAAHDRDSAYRAFYPEWLSPHQANGPQGHVSKHYPGLSVLILPAYALGDWLGNGAYGAGRFAVAGLLGVIASLVVVNVALLTIESGAGTRWGLTIAAIIAVLSPVLSYSFLIFPELPAGLLVVYAFRRARLMNGPRRAVLVGLALAALPWLHARLALLTIALILFYLLRQRRSILEFTLLMGPVALSAVTIATYNLWAFGTVLPNTGDHAGFGGPFDGLRGLFGLLFDQQWGLLIYHPILLLAAAGLVALWRGGRSSVGRADLIGFAFVVGPYLILIALYRQWWGEWGPPARYLAPIVPLLALPLALARPGDIASWLVAGLLVVPSLAVSALFVAWPRAMYNHPTGEAELAQRIADAGGPSLIRWLPAIVAPNSASLALTMFWGLLTLAVIVFLAGGLTQSPEAPSTSRQRLRSSD